MAFRRTPVGLVKAELRAVVHRADGTVEDHGVIARYDRNPLKRWLWEVRKWLKERSK